MRHQLFEGKLWCPLFLLSLKFFDARVFLKHTKGPSTMFFGTVRQKISIGSQWYPRPMQKMFRNQNFSETRKGSATKIFGAVRQISSIEVSDMPFLWISFFDTRFFLKHRRFLLRNVRYGETKQFVRKIVIPATCLIPKFFRYQKISKSQKGFSTKFSVVWDRKHLTDIVIILPPTTYPKNFSIPVFFGNTEGFLYDFFRYCETSTLRRKVSRISFILKLFWRQKFFETKKGPCTKILGTVRQKISSGN